VRDDESLNILKKSHDHDHGHTFDTCTRTSYQHRALCLAQSLHSAGDQASNTLLHQILAN
jgi:hypothetical protein